MFPEVEHIGGQATLPLATADIISIFFDRGDGFCAGA